MRTACKLTAFIVSCLMACMTADISAQTISIKGKVTDSGTSEPLVGVTVMIKGSSAGTSTAADGTYAISASSGDVLVFSIIGYKSAEAAVENDRAVINMALEEDAEMLEETVVVGYGTMDKKELTSAISHISSEDFLVTGGGDPAMLIQGKVAGVSITNTGVGNPNSTASIQIRGISSRKAGLEPLIVIDGIAGGDLANLNQNDIESIDILKDGAASAIYGTRGSNGVIQITTKKGSQDGSIHIRISGGPKIRYQLFPGQRTPPVLYQQLQELLLCRRKLQPPVSPGKFHPFKRKIKFSGLVDLQAAVPSFFSHNHTFIHKRSLSSGFARLYANDDFTGFMISQEGFVHFTSFLNFS